MTQCIHSQTSSRWQSREIGMIDEHFVWPMHSVLIHSYIYTKNLQNRNGCIEEIFNEFLHWMTFPRYTRHGFDQPLPVDTLVPHINSSSFTPRSNQFPFNHGKPLGSANQSSLLTPSSSPGSHKRVCQSSFLPVILKTNAANWACGYSQTVNLFEFTFCNEFWFKHVYPKISN